jgi:hypothetical protein
LPHTGREQLESGSVQCSACGGELCDDVGAVAMFFEHADDAADLPFDAAQSFDDVLGRTSFDFRDSDVTCTPRGMQARIANICSRSLYPLGYREGGADVSTRDTAEIAVSRRFSIGSVPS